MVTSRDKIRPDIRGEPPRRDDSPRPTVDETIFALARLLGRQAAREAIRAALADSQATVPAPATPATTTDEE